MPPAFGGQPQSPSPSASRLGSGGLRCGVSSICQVTLPDLGAAPSGGLFWELLGEGRGRSFQGRMWEAFRYLLSPGHCSRGRGHRPREAPRHPFRESEGSAVSPLSSAPSQVAGPPFCLLPSGSLCLELFPGCGGWGARCLLDREAGEEETGLRPGPHVPAIHRWRLHPSPLPPGLGVRPAHPGRHRHGPGRPRPLCKRHPVAVVRLHGHRPPVRSLALCHDLRVRMGAGMEAAGQLRTPVVAGE